MSPQPKPGDGRSNKRRRELARAKEARQAARRAEKQSAQRRRTLVVASVAVLVVIVGLLAVTFWPDSSSTPTAAASASAAAPSAADASPSAVLADCSQAPQAQSNPKTYSQAPANQLASGTKYDLVLKTNCGTITIGTYPTKAPKTVNSMLWLAQQGYFNNTPCHRLTTAGIFVLQCGDPTGAGTGSPGYKVPDENLPKAGGVTYPAGTVAMANAGPGTSGSQFFIVYQDTTLPSSYTIWGKVSSGLDIVQSVAAAGVSGGGSDGPPAQPIGILTATPDPKLAS